MHRPSNVDDNETFKGIVDALDTITREIEIVFSAHPRTQKRMEEFDIYPQSNNFRIIDPLSYRDFLRLYKNSKFVLTDSGSIQQETHIFEYFMSCDKRKYRKAFYYN